MFTPPPCFWRRLHDRRTHSRKRIAAAECAAPVRRATLDRIFRERIERTVKRTQASGFPDVGASFGRVGAVGRAIPGHMLPGHTLPGQALPGQTVSGQARSGAEALELADQRMYRQKAARGKKQKEDACRRGPAGQLKEEV